MNFSRFTSSGSSEARIAALEATSGRRAHQTWRRLGAGNGVIGVRSRRLSIPISAIGSHRSISRVVMRFLIYRLRKSQANDHCAVTQGESVHTPGGEGAALARPWG